MALFSSREWGILLIIVDVLKTVHISHRGSRGPGGTIQATSSFLRSPDPPSSVRAPQTRVLLREPLRGHRAASATAGPLASGAAWGRLPGCVLQHRCDLGLPGRNRGNVVDAQWAACSCQHPGVRSPSRDPNDSVPHPCVTPPNSTPYHGRSGGRDHRAQCGLFR